MPIKYIPPRAKNKPGEALISCPLTVLVSTLMLAWPVMPRMKSLYPRTMQTNPTTTGDILNMKYMMESDRETRGSFFFVRAFISPSNLFNTCEF